MWKRLFSVQWCLVPWRLVFEDWSTDKYILKNKQDNKLISMTACWDYNVVLYPLFHEKLIYLLSFFHNQVLKNYYIKFVISLVWCFEVLIWICFSYFVNLQEYIFRHWSAPRIIKVSTSEIGKDLPVWQGTPWLHCTHLPVYVEKTGFI